jgi:hypothetical protein
MLWGIFPWYLSKFVMMMTTINSTVVASTDKFKIFVLNLLMKVNPKNLLIHLDVTGFWKGSEAAPYIQ